MAVTLSDEKALSHSLEGRITLTRLVSLLCIISDLNWGEMFAAEGMKAYVAEVQGQQRPECENEKPLLKAEG